jgi:hypothetical protein
VPGTGHTLRATRRNTRREQDAAREPGEQAPIDNRSPPWLQKRESPTVAGTIGPSESGTSVAHSVSAPVTTLLRVLVLSVPCAPEGTEGPYFRATNVLIVLAALVVTALGIHFFTVRW